MADDLGSCEGEEPYDRSALRLAPERLRCGHCGQLFDPASSAVGDHGICQPCFDD